MRSSPANAAPGRRADGAARLGASLQRLHAGAPRAARAGRPGSERPARRARRRERRRRAAGADVIYVRAVLDLLASDVPVHGLAHITGDGVLNLLRLAAAVGLRDRRAAARAGDLRDWSASTGRSTAAEAYEVFNMGCGFVCVVPRRARRRGGATLSRRHPGQPSVGSATAHAGRMEMPSWACGDRRGLRAAGSASADRYAQQSRSRR